MQISENLNLIDLSSVSYPKFERPSAHDEITIGLLSELATVSPKYLYDNLGSKLFEAICELPEYYVTRLEANIIENYREDILHNLGIDHTFIDLGAGNCLKAAKLFELLRPRQYVPLDISIDFLIRSVDAIRNRYPAIQMLPLPMDLSRGLNLPSKVSTSKRLFFYPGSSIGNYSPSEALNFLKTVRKEARQDGGILIGIDLAKDKKVLESAYNDSLGVTGSFNRNVLRNLNTLIGSNFDLKDWSHKAIYDRNLQRIEMHLIAQHDLQVDWQGGHRRFKRGESIHTENSYKYEYKDFLHLLKKAGFKTEKEWLDDRSWFMVCYARVDDRQSWT